MVYPKWLPGEHGPTGPIADLVGLNFSADGKAISWRRDPQEMFAFQVNVPVGATQLDIELDYLPPSGSGQFTAGAATSDRLSVMSWNTLLLYPAGTLAHEIMFRPSLTLPPGWGFGAALVEEVRMNLRAGLLPHEFVHSWNAKYRRPEGLTRDDFQTPYQTDLFWVYEGLTSYLGWVLTSRSGLWTPEYARDSLARIAARLSYRPGRTWRPLIDTTRAAQILYDGPSEGSSWRRGVDFYDEGVLIWLEVDTLIRQLSNGRRTLDDFCRAFFGGASGLPVVLPYSYQDLVAALGEVAAYDWKGFFDTRIYSIQVTAPLNGITNSGWRLVYTEEPNLVQQGRQDVREQLDLSFSLGFSVSTKDNRVLDVLPGSPAAAGGLPPASILVAVNGRRWTPEILQQAVTNARESDEPIRLLVENSEFFNQVLIDYHAGARHPHLERDERKRNLLRRILAPRVR